jgi:hypothetical protein
MSSGCSTHGRQETCIKNSSRKIRRKEITYEDLECSDGVPCRIRLLILVTAVMRIKIAGQMGKEMCFLTSG